MSNYDMLCWLTWMMQLFVLFNCWGSQKDYKRLADALSERLSLSTGQQEWWWQLGQRVQEAEESLDTFADTLIHLANSGHPEQDLTIKMKVMLDMATKCPQPIDDNQP